MPQSIAPDLADSLPAEIAVVDPDGRIVRHNHKWGETARTGHLGPKPEGWNYIAECEAAAARGNSDAPRILAGLRSVLSGETPTFFSSYLCPFDGLQHWFQIAISALDIEGRLHAVIMHVDVSSLQADSLTGLANRAMFEAQLALNLESARESGRQTGIVFVDINHLKKINDTHGHLVGDAAVKALAETLVKLVSPGCVVTRLSGDEFGIVLPVGHEMLAAQRLNLALTNGIACVISASRAPLRVSASLGVAYFPQDGMTARELLTAADRAMYKQKRGASVA